MVPTDRPLLELPRQPMSELHHAIGRHIADLIEDGATLQMGIGGIPDAVLFYLREKNDLGIHTEMFSDGIMELVNAGVITCERKTLHPHKIIASFVLGSRPLFDFIDNNPLIELHPVYYTNDPFVIAQNDKMVAINSALQVDLTGQVCADSIGRSFYSGFGGQTDFIRGAARAKGGKPIIALPSTAKDGRLSRIVPVLDTGAGVVDTRADVHYVVTEHGVASLFGKSVRERARELIRIAHPKFRDELTAWAVRAHYLPAGEVVAVESAA
jgi:acyl-CoA hydrolase